MPFKPKQKRWTTQSAFAHLLNENFNPISPIFCLRTSQITLTTLYTTKL